MNTTLGLLFTAQTPDRMPRPRQRAAVWSLALLAWSLTSLLPAQTITAEFPIPTAASFPHTIAAGPDGNLWFAEGDANKIGRITTAGLITEFPVPTASSDPTGIAAGPDGNLWVTEGAARNIGRITRPASSPSSRPPCPTAGRAASRLARMATSGLPKTPATSGGSPQPG